MFNQSDKIHCKNYNSMRGGDLWGTLLNLVTGSIGVGTRTINSALSCEVHPLYFTYLETAYFIGLELRLGDKVII